MKIDRVLKRALEREFGPPFDVSALPDEVRFVYEHPKRLAEEALATARALGTASAAAPYTLLAGFYSSRGLNAGTLDLNATASVVAISSGLPGSLVYAFSAVTERLDVGIVIGLPDPCCKDAEVGLADAVVQLRTGRKPLDDSPVRIEKCV